VNGFRLQIHVVNRDPLNKAGWRYLCGILHFDQSTFVERFSHVLGTVNSFATLARDVMSNRVRPTELSVEPTSQLFLLT
jgi:hypothetical protein